MSLLPENSSIHGTNMEECTRMYFCGMIDGIRMYAHLKDGVQYVGTTGKTLDQALAELYIRQENALKRKA